MLNVCVIKGRLVRDVELRRTGSGTAVASFTIASTRDMKNSDGTKESDFIDCVAWAKTAEYVEKYFHKGSLAIVKGRLQIRTWTDKDGNKRKTAEVVLDTIDFADSKSSGGSQPAADNYAVMEDDDAVLPF